MDNKKEKQPYNRDDYVAVGKIFDTLKRTNEQTLVAQQIMNKYGYDLKEDGFYGPITDKATKSYINMYANDYMWNEMKSKVEGIFK
tara:strand:- start:1255 stop:1512 length:258 start_codon:yes stop_codon:yes gene_type:complete